MTDTAPSESHLVVSPEAAAQTTEMMRQVVCSDRGTGDLAQVEGLSIAGKTGTAYKAADNGTYFDDNGERIYYASFVGFFPSDDPQVTVLVSVDEPPAGDRRPLRRYRRRPRVRRARTDAHPRTRDRSDRGIDRLRAGLIDATDTTMILVSELMAELVAEMEGGREVAHVLRLAPSPFDAELLDVELLGVAHDSRAVAPGALFACLRGAASDGHDHAAQAVASGATALLVDHELPAVDSVAQLVVDDTRRALGPVSSLVYERPSRRLTTVGITGTNGKTTTAQLTAAIFEANGWTTGVVGTLHGARTTPEAPELQQTLATFVDEGASAAVLEVSSHALALHRVDGTEFDAVIFTNLGRDHLDLHGSTEEYFRAKAQLFDVRFAPLALVNTDDPYGRLLADVIAGTDGLRVVELSLDQVSDIEVTTSTHSYTWRGRRRRGAHRRPLQRHELAQRAGHRRRVG